MIGEKTRFRYDYSRHCWRWTTGQPLRHCDICSGPHIRRGICEGCRVARNAEIKKGRLLWTRMKGRPGAYPILSTGNTKCIDCTKRGHDTRATEWDHRDWREPLKVEPVCRMHNARRGRAMTAHEASFK